MLYRDKFILCRHGQGQALETCSDSFPSVPALSVARETVLLDEQCNLRKDVRARGFDGMLAVQSTFFDQQ